MKKILIVLISSFFVLNAFALSGFTEFIPTESGQFVYYRDFTFDNPTYIGFLYYSEDMISARVFMKIDKNDDKDILIYFSLDPNANHIEFTGEKLPENLTNDDTTTINYIHNMLYELSRFRIQEAKLSQSKNQVCKTVDFAQFGGQVQITFDNSIPFFNIKSVEKINGEKLFECVTIGTIKSNEDLTFQNFFGIPPAPIFKTKKLSKNQLKKFEWKTQNEMFKTLGNDALMYENQIEVPESDFEKAGFSIFDYSQRNLLLSSNTSYINFETAKIVKNANKITASYDVYSPNEKETFTHVIKILEKNENGTTLKVISAYKKFYEENKQFFDTLYRR